MAGPPSPNEPSNRASIDADRRLLYIAGYGRSGSTVLDIALSSHPDIAGFGELSSAFEALAAPPDELEPFWRDIAETTEARADGAERANGADRATRTSNRPPKGRPSGADFRRMAKVVAAAERLLPGRALRPGSALRASHQRIHATFLTELFQRTGATVLVDSSKSSWLHTWRLPLLAPLVPEIHCLVLVRDLEGVVRSVRRGHGETLQPQRLPIVRAVLGWTVATVSAAIVGHWTCGAGRTHLVRHERFVADPGGHLAAIFHHLGLDVDRPAIDEQVGDGYRPTHQMVGNRVRGERHVVIRALPTDGEPLPIGARIAIGVASRLVDNLALCRLTPLATNPPTGRTPTLAGPSPTHELTDRRVRSHRPIDRPPRPTTGTGRRASGRPSSR